MRRQSPSMRSVVPLPWYDTSVETPKDDPENATLSLSRSGVPGKLRSTDRLGSAFFNPRTTLGFVPNADGTGATAAERVMGAIKIVKLALETVLQGGDPGARLLEAALGLGLTKKGRYLVTGSADHLLRLASQVLGTNFDATKFQKWPRQYLGVALCSAAIDLVGAAPHVVTPSSNLVIGGMDSTVYWTQFNVSPAFFGTIFQNVVVAADTPSVTGMVPCAGTWNGSDERASAATYTNFPFRFSVEVYEDAPSGFAWCVFPFLLGMHEWNYGFSDIGAEVGTCTTMYDLHLLASRSPITNSIPERALHNIPVIVEPHVPYPPIPPELPRTVLPTPPEGPTPTRERTATTRAIMSAIGRLPPSPRSG